MRIESYQFGKIVVDRTSYRKDIALTPLGLIADWIRGDGHSLTRADLELLDFSGIETLVVGIGAMGMMRIEQDAREFCLLHEIDLQFAVTGKAVELYNRLPAETTVGLFHITC